MTRDTHGSTPRPDWFPVWEPEPDDPEAESPRASDVESEWDFPMRHDLDALRATAVSLPRPARHRSVRSNTGRYGASTGWRYVAECAAVVGLRLFVAASLVAGAVCTVEGLIWLGRTVLGLVLKGVGAI